MRIALLHLAPVTGDIEHNRRLVERGVEAAAKSGAQWAVTPELCIPGYLFLRTLGTGWIQPQPDHWMNEFCGLVSRLGITVFLSHPELDPASGRMYNTVFVINPEGEIIGRHRKIKALGGAEAWSTGGWKISPFECDGVQAGVLICADAYKNDVAEVLVSKGAQVLVSPRFLGPGRLRSRRRMGGPVRSNRSANYGLQPDRRGARRAGLSGSRERCGSTRAKVA